MNNLTTGSIPLFRFAGIQVYLHWSWLLVFFFAMQARADQYRSMVWNVLEYLGLFAIVLLHEFGHALACRQVGGKADRIMLWPLGGVAFVQPPPRPGALLWSIAAGPLVNVVLVPFSIGAILFVRAAGLSPANSDFANFLSQMAGINLVLLIFNMVPIYPLDGGQILQALLWFIVGQARSLMVSGIFGLVAAAGVIVLALVDLKDRWLALIAAFVAWQAWRGFNMGVRLRVLQPTLEVLNEAMANLRAGRLEEAQQLFTQVIDSSSDAGILAPTLTNRGQVRCRLGRWAEAITDYREALRVQPDFTSAQHNLAWVLAAGPVDALRNGPEAVAHATRACDATGWRDGSLLGTLAAAYAETGDFGQAIHWQERAIADAAYRRMIGDAAASERLKLYEQGYALRLPMTGG
jgi:Zn-dependent protease